MNKESDILTMAFVNIEPLNEIYSTAEALKRGTLFPDIDKPFTAKGEKK